ncbi:Na+/H+ antiporter [Pseudonocardiaceae bacterium YIM PH 21723]|nr:Na+/H+ antiporter [Pseudonocardiaceae bacterium YIM PH 21723]
MHLAAEIVGLVIAVLVVTVVARRLDWPAPLCLVVVGVGVSFLPGMPEFHLDPELVLLGFLPPLLYATAIQTSVADFRANRRSIALLSVGLVILTTVVVGFVVWWVLPGVPLAAGFALGAVVAPPDAVAATAVARRVGLPRQMVSILEGESLVNDAAALVALRTSIAALATVVTAWQIGLDFLLAAGVGVAVGIVVGVVAGWMRRRLTDTVTDTAISLVIPFAAYLPAEHFHGSGVLAVVVAGLIIGHYEPRVASGRARLSSRINWQTVQFLLENAVFLLIGLQLRGILIAVGASELSFPVLAAVCAAVLAATVLTRLALAFGAGVVLRLLGRESWPWSWALVLGWAGMRGVVTLAAAFVLPENTPHRDVLVLAAFVVVAGTLLIQGSTLTKLVRRLGLPKPDVGQDLLQEAAVIHDMHRAGVARLAEHAPADDPFGVIERLQDNSVRRSDRAWERLGSARSDEVTPSQLQRTLRCKMLEAEREELLAARSRGAVDDVVFRRVLSIIDIEEALLEGARMPDLDSESPLHASAQTAGTCEHLESAPAEATADSDQGCPDCIAEGSDWVHLRICLGCGHVGCCDSSPRKHATQHFHDTRHPVMRSFEPGEHWRWCFVDGIVG